MKTILLATSAALALASFSGAAMAQQAVTATTDLNVRSGPGPQYEVIGVIGADQAAQVDGCAEASKWCMVSHNGVQGWAYSDYLIADYEGREVVYTERAPEAPVVTYDGPSGGGVAGAATGAIAGALIAGPIGAAVGGIAGGVAGGVTDRAIEPDAQVRTYIESNPVEPVYLEGEVVVGAQIPDTVEYYEVPDYEYRYVYVNNQPVLVEPESRRIVYVVR